jgi:serine/threonine-protein kinase
MDQSRERFRRIDQLFDAALDLAPNDRDAFLDTACGSDAVARERVAALLTAHERSAAFLKTPATEFAAVLLDESAGSNAAPDRVGPFRVIRELGRGGMGAVFLGERDDGQFQQRVALKLVRQGAGSGDLVRRFLEERRILALLDHPRIARLVDGGVTDDGLPYFAMEFVEGEPIHRYCDNLALSIERRLELFVAVCEAVQYAHHQLVVHRDLKPSNVLVGADGQPKLLDFGIAKPLRPDAEDEDGPLTRPGAYPMTPEYAAPEQLQGRHVSPATDVYALGVLLYTLLAGRRPYEVRGRSPADIERIVCETDPEPPSATFDESRGADDAGERARARGARPDRLRRTIAGDLDTIVLKALRKEPRERYASAEALAGDISRHLSGHPVLARPQTTAYRLRRFVRRNRWQVTAAGVFALLLTTYAITVTIKQAQVRRALLEAQLGTRRAEQVTDYMLGLFKASEGGRLFTDTLRTREQLDRGVAQARALPGQPELRAQMLDVIGRIQTYLGQYERAKPLLREALAIRRDLHGEQHADVATSLESLAEATARDVSATLELRRQAMALRRRLADDAKTSDALFELALALHRAGNVAAAKPLFDEWMAAIARQPREVTPARVSQLMMVGKFWEFGGRVDRAEPMFREALAVSRTLYGDRHHDVGMTLAELGEVLDRERRGQEADTTLRSAVEILRATYPQGHPDLASALRLQGIVLSHSKGFRDAEAPLREAVAMRRRFFGSDAVDVATTELDLSYVLVSMARHDEAAGLARDAIRIYRRQLGDATPLLYHAQAYLADALRGQGRFGEAEALLLATYGKFAKPTPVTRGWRDHAIAALVRLYDARGNPGEAAKYRALLDSTRR